MVSLAEKTRDQLFDGFRHLRNKSIYAAERQFETLTDMEKRFVALGVGLTPKSHLRDYAPHERKIIAGGVMMCKRISLKFRLLVNVIDFLNIDYGVSYED